MPNSISRSRTGARLSRPARIQNLEVAARELAAEYQWWLNALPESLAESEMACELSVTIEQLEESADSLGGIDPPCIEWCEAASSGPMMNYPPVPCALRERSLAMEADVKGITGHYKEYLDGVNEYAAHLQRKIDTLERLAGELLRGKGRRSPPDIDDDCQF